MVPMVALAVLTADPMMDRMPVLADHLKVSRRVNETQMKMRA
jgi:hypothetical protein